MPVFISIPAHKAGQNQNSTSSKSIRQERACASATSAIDQPTMSQV